MKISFTIKSPPFSINAAYYKRSKTRTTQCRAWGDGILSQLQNPNIQSMFKTFKGAISDRPLIGLNLTFQYPIDVLYTKAGHISRRSMDLSNIEKMLIDLIFDNRFHERGTPNLNLDDKFIVDLKSEKRPSKDDDFHILVDIYIIEKLS